MQGSYFFILFIRAKIFYLVITLGVIYRSDHMQVTRYLLHYFINILQFIVYKLVVRAPYWRKISISNKLFTVWAYLSDNAYASGQLETSI